MIDDQSRELLAEYCYGCSANNPEGLHLRFEQIDSQQVRSRATLRKELCGWQGVAHGGMIALLIDEVTSWCMAMCVGPQPFATRKMSVRYLRPTPTEQPLELIGKLVRDRGATVEFLGEIRLSDGSITARGNVEIARLERERYERFVRQTRG